MKEQWGLSGEDRRVADMYVRDEGVECEQDEGGAPLMAALSGVGVWKPPGVMDVVVQTEALRRSCVRDEGV